jgi:hypothetical protein
MSFEQMFVIRDEVLKVIDSEDLKEDLNRESKRSSPRSMTARSPFH